MPAPDKTGFSLSSAEGPMTPAAETREFNIEKSDDDEAPSGSGVYTPGTISRGFYPSGTNTSHQRYNAFTHDPSTFRRLSYPGDSTLSGSSTSKVRKWTRRYVRRLKQAPVVVKLLLLLGWTVIIAVLIKAVPKMQLPMRSGLAWRDIQRRLEHGLGARELCDPYV